MDSHRTTGGRGADRGTGHLFPGRRNDLSLDCPLHHRRHNTGSPVDFEIRGGLIAPTHRKTVGIIDHPCRQFWGVTRRSCRLKTGGPRSQEKTPSDPVAV